MSQLTLRVPEGLVDDLKAAAARRGTSVNAFASDVLRAAVDPAFAATGTDELRERLRRAGLLVEADPSSNGPATPALDATTRRRLRRGAPLSHLVNENRR